MVIVMRLQFFELVASLVLAVSFISLVSVEVYADTVMLSNGDRVTGEVTNTQDGKLTVISELMGTVEIPLKAVVSLQTKELLTATFSNGDRITGRILGEREEIRVTREDQSAVTRTFSELEAVRDANNQLAYERRLERRSNPGWLDFWSLEADVGLASAQGNAHTTTVNSGATAQRTTGLDETTLDLEQIYSTQESREPFGTTANSMRGGAHYQRNLSSHFFFFGAAGVEFDEFQDLDLGTLLGGGFGWQVIKNERHSWDIGAGGNWYREKFATDLVRNSGEINLSEESDHKVNTLLRIHQGFYFFPNLSQSGEFRIRATAGVELRVTDLLAFTFLVSSRYLSNPLPGHKKNDLLISTGLRFRWVQD
jgi:putative salt-induced outer membrane protein YdiY